MKRLFSACLLTICISVLVTVPGRGQEFNDPSRTERRDDAGLMGKDGAKSGFFQTFNPVNYPAGASGWWHLLDVRHTNYNLDLAMQFSGSFFDQYLYFRKTNYNASQTWSRILQEFSDGSVDNYATAFYAANDTRPGGVNTPRTTLSLFAGGTGYEAYAQKWNLKLGSWQHYLPYGPNKYSNQLVFSTTSGDDNYAGESQVLTLQGNGNVGIGTADVQDALTVGTLAPTDPGARKAVWLNAGGYGEPTAFNTNSNGDKLVLYNSTAANYDGRMGVGSNGNLWLKSFGPTANAGGKIEFYTGNVLSPRVTVAENGKVGIGTSSPRADLDNGGTAQNGATRMVFARMAEGDGTGDGTYLGVRAFGTQPASAKSFSIENHFFGDKNCAINFNRGVGTTGGFLTFETGNGTQQMVIDGNGRVGIGTASVNTGDYRLFVETGIRTRKVRVDQDNWPDYVFGPSYQLPSLLSVEAFIMENRRLPEMPSAKQVADDGIDLGSNQAVLLKKLEEITLYMIEMKKENEKLSRRIEKLESTRTDQP